MAVKKSKKETASPKTKAASGKSGTAPKKSALASKRAKSATAKKAGSKAAPPNQNFDNVMDMIEHDLTAILDTFMGIAKLFNNLSPTERARLIGAGVRNYGFIEKARDIARDNPTYLPPNFDVEQFSADLESFDKVRQVYLLAEKLQTIASDKMLLMSNDLYRESLRIYNTLKEQSKARVAGARDLFMALETFFKKRRPSDRPPTEAEEIRRARGIIKGTVDGEMLLKNEKAKKTGGVHEVVEDIHKDQIAGKESAEFSEKE